MEYWCNRSWCCCFAYSSTSICWCLMRAGWRKQHGLVDPFALGWLRLPLAALGSKFPKAPIRMGLVFSLWIFCGIIGNWASVPDCSWLGAWFVLSPVDVFLAGGVCQCLWYCLVPVLMCALWRVRGSVSSSGSGFGHLMSPKENSCGVLLGFLLACSSGVTVTLAQLWPVRADLLSVAC